MSLRLLIDEDTQGKILVQFLRASGHNVVTVNEVALMGQDDSVVLDFARTDNRVLLTRNCRDYQLLHLANQEHPGILCIYHERDYTKDMSVKDIVRAIANIEATNIPLANQFISLNQWNY